MTEQRRIVTSLDELYAKVDALKCLEGETTARLDALMPAILAMVYTAEI
jgi:hypothetical protein